MPASSAFLPRRIPQKTKRRVLSTVDGSNHIRVRYLRTGPRPTQMKRVIHRCRELTLVPTLRVGTSFVPLRGELAVDLRTYP